ncbi:hypothetical protein Rsub_02454 [Raphidocelis subcapitata]|uniref:Uncharacterized protein n=1 Tax=Raphidocelis subcapitata TaxID=307507 RepID=A0A2V0NRP5_9CHLO|nr:hypothetical protein Rsub_02454 [Raphidocelis subcapitata]|eukprot:GBF90348.1 hypothetical protein Rsub_02454 [Raphidocelis subcapitata]
MGMERRAAAAAAGAGAALVGGCAARFGKMLRHREAQRALNDRQDGLRRSEEEMAAKLTRVREEAATAAAAEANAQRLMDAAADMRARVDAAANDTGRRQTELSARLQAFERQQAAAAEAARLSAAQARADIRRSEDEAARVRDELARALQLQLEEQVELNLQATDQITGLEGALAQRAQDLADARDRTGCAERDAADQRTRAQQAEAALRELRPRLTLELAESRAAGRAARATLQSTTTGHTQVVTGLEQRLAEAQAAMARADEARRTDCRRIEQLQAALGKARARIACKARTASTAKAEARARLAKARGIVLKLSRDNRGTAAQLAACKEQLEATQQELRAALDSTAVLKQQLAERSAAADGGCPKPPPKAASSSDAGPARSSSSYKRGNKGKGVGPAAKPAPPATYKQALMGPATKGVVSGAPSFKGVTPSDSREGSRHVSCGSSCGPAAKSSRTSSSGDGSGAPPARRSSRGSVGGPSAQGPPAQRPAWGQGVQCQQKGWQLSFRDVVRGPDVFW